MFPAAWFQPISVGTFTKGLTYSDLWFNALVLAVFAVGYLHCRSYISAEAGELRCRSRARRQIHENRGRRMP